MGSTGSWAEYVLIGVSGIHSGESLVPKLVLLGLLLGLEGTKMDRASVSSNISAMTNGSGVRRGARTRNVDFERLANGECHGGGTWYRGLAPTREGPVELGVRAWRARNRR